MRKGIIVFVCILCMVCGCTTKGSFEKGNKNFSLLFEHMNKNIEKGKMDLALLNEIAMSKQEVEKNYQLDMTKLQEVEVHTSIVPAQLGEVAFFHCDKENDAMLKEGIEYRMNMLKTQWSSYIQDADQIFQSAKQGRIGQYYYFVLGVDSEKMVNYIQNEK